MELGPIGVVADAYATPQDLARGDTAGAYAPLAGFVNEVAAQSGKKIPTATADQLVASAHSIRTTIRC